jgi:sulfhydrogenase subunit beta (sulfur reductase)
MYYYSIKKEEWDKTLEQLLLSYTIFASVKNEFGQDYELIKPANIAGITYNIPKPATSLKSFFLPVKENVTSSRGSEKPRIILGIPNCDIAGLSLLDSIYLDEDFYDIFYNDRRENTILISSDCFGKQEHCHCLTYGIKPYSEKISDLAIVLLDGIIILRILTGKGEEFVRNIFLAQPVTNENILTAIDNKRKAVEEALKSTNSVIPDYGKTGNLINEANMDIYIKHSSHCVSCGACTSICPTCTCFLLIEKPGFEKVKQMDACQYPGFERVAGGEDALFEIKDRFRNRYLCKYVWKPGKFNSVACTGCGRCIEACIGKINKNEILVELTK